MARSFGPSSPTQPLSVGDIVSAAFQLYRSHLKQYLGIAVQATLWLLLPMLGTGRALWARGADWLRAQSNLVGLIVLLIPVCDCAVYLLWSQSSGVLGADFLAGLWRDDPAARKRSSRTQAAVTAPLAVF